MTRYHWFVLLVSSMGWMFDAMNQQIFNLARRPAITELLASKSTGKSLAGLVAEYAGYSTSIFILGWAVGGVIFGVLGDRLGRVKTMIITILGYSVFTGLTSLSTNVWQFSGICFLTGLAPIRRGRGAGGGSHARPRAALRAGAAAGAFGGGQHDGRVHRHRARPVGTVGRHRQLLAHHVHGRRAAGAARHPGVPQAQGTRAVAARQGRKKDDG
jgi:MFS family permease